MKLLPNGRLICCARFAAEQQSDDGDGELLARFIALISIYGIMALSSLLGMLAARVVCLACLRLAQGHC